MGLFWKKRKVVIALGGGAARGFANLGVLKVLDKERIPIDLVVGSSMGGLVAATYCLGMPMPQLERMVEKFKVAEIVDMTIPRVALIKGKKLAKKIEELTDHKNFEDARIPFAVTTTDVETGEERVHTKGNLQKLIQASCSWPGIFMPVRVEGRLLADGGIRNSIPVKSAQALGATFTIAVKIGFVVKKDIPTNIFQMWMQSIQIMGEELDRYQSMQADVVIEPHMPTIDQFGFERGKEAIQAGEEAARRAIPKLKKLLNIR